jgi:hypothetical protein
MEQLALRLVLIKQPFLLKPGERKLQQEPQNPNGVLLEVEYGVSLRHPMVMIPTTKF